MYLSKATHIFLFMMFAFGLCNAQAASEWSGYYPESYLRQIAIMKVIPTYPSDAIRRGVTGVIQAKIAIDHQGQVVKIKIHPSIDPALKQAVADAVDQWTFQLRSEFVHEGRNCLGRLTFRFSIDGTESQVELHDPAPAPKDKDHLGYWNGAIERDNWRKWEEVKPSRSK